MVQSIQSKAYVKLNNGINGNKIGYDKIQYFYSFVIFHSLII